MSDESSSSSGCGCVGLIATILVLWALVFGLPVPGGVFHIDLFPPALRLETDE